MNLDAIVNARSARREITALEALLAYRDARQALQAIRDRSSVEWEQARKRRRAAFRVMIEAAERLR
jgi:hypothetical protein